MACLFDSSSPGDWGPSWLLRPGLGVAERRQPEALQGQQRLSAAAVVAEEVVVVEEPEPAPAAEPVVARQESAASAGQVAVLAAAAAGEVEQRERVGRERGAGDAEAGVEDVEAGVPGDGHPGRCASVISGPAQEPESGLIVAEAVPEPAVVPVPVEHEPRAAAVAARAEQHNDAPDGGVAAAVVAAAAAERAAGGARHRIGSPSAGRAESCRAVEHIGVYCCTRWHG